MMLRVVPILLLAAVSAQAATVPPPWQRTETRAECAAYDPLRAPFVGETHIHTAYSFDARIGDVTNTPTDAYAFAKGAPVGLPPYDALGQPLRQAQLRRPLDFVGLDAIFSVLSSICTLDEALKDAEHNVRSSARNIAAVLAMGQRMG